MLVIQLYSGAPLSSSTRKCAGSWHVSVIASGASDSVFVVTTTADGGLVSTSSICGTCRGHPGHLALGMFGGAAYILLLLLGRLAVALAVDVFLPLTLLALEWQFPYAFYLHPTNETLVFVLSTFPLRFYPSVLGILELVVRASSTSLWLRVRSSH